MWVIAAMSIVSLAAAIERAIFLFGARDDADARDAFHSSIAAGHAPESKASRTPFDRLREEAARSWDDRDALAPALEGAIEREAAACSRHLHILELTYRAAPLLGLLGTVLGMVSMFGSLESGATGPAAVSGGIRQALFTTVAGLAAAIPSAAAHSLLQARVDAITSSLASEACSLIALRASRDRDR